MSRMKDSAVAKQSYTLRRHPALPTKPPYFPVRDYTVIDMKVVDACLSDQEKAELATLLNKCNAAYTLEAVSTYINRLEEKVQSNAN